MVEWNAHDVETTVAPSRNTIILNIFKYPAAHEHYL